nr:unnamed protein product [Callosobruchus analis]
MSEIEMNVIYSHFHLSHYKPPLTLIEDIRGSEMEDIHSQAHTLQDKPPLALIEDMSEMDEIDVNHKIVWRVLNGSGLFPIKAQRLQHLLRDDHPRRVAFSEWIVDEQNVQIYPVILYSDEKTFVREESYNLRNNHYWAPKEAAISAVSSKNSRWMCLGWSDRGPITMHWSPGPMPVYAQSISTPTTTSCSSRMLFQVCLKMFLFRSGLILMQLFQGVGLVELVWWLGRRGFRISICWIFCCGVTLKPLSTKKVCRTQQKS